MLSLLQCTLRRWTLLGRAEAINAIIGLTEMMVTNATRFGTEKALEPLRRVNAAGTHLLSLINEVLDRLKPASLNSIPSG